MSPHFPPLTCAIFRCTRASRVPLSTSSAANRRCVSCTNGTACWIFWAHCLAGHAIDWTIRWAAALSMFSVPGGSMRGTLTRPRQRSPYVFKQPRAAASLSTRRRSATRAASSQRGRSPPFLTGTRSTRRAPQTRARARQRTCRLSRWPRLNLARCRCSTGAIRSIAWRLSKASSTGSLQYYAFRPSPACAILHMCKRCFGVEGHDRWRCTCGSPAEV
mmetsp:Transcript_29900/g.69748  ORF Transcript_29900/g.69748 Transcript_29900/m.69748 type:complete len:218 (-) Transcript_29900:358-1011(-)